MRIIADRDIPFLDGVFDRYAEVLYRPWDSFKEEEVRDADALIIRCRTRCDAGLLHGSKVKMIASADAGIDNVDLNWCSSNGIFVQNAVGCNASGVMNYVFSALYGIAARKRIDLDGKTFGIIGAGNIGSRVERVAKFLGFTVLVCDPPRAEREQDAQFSTLDYLLERSDIVSIHVPLDQSTRRMADSSFFSRMKFGAFFINTSRGDIVDETALIEAMPKLGPVVIDTWCNEPDINLKLMDLVDIATPHIAGFSYQGKQNGTRTAVRSVARYFDIKELFDFFPEADIQGLDSVYLDLKGKTQGQRASLFQYNYPVFTDDFMLRMNPAAFESLRSAYHFRREFYIE